MFPPLAPSYRPYFREALPMPNTTGLDSHLGSQKVVSFGLICFAPLPLGACGDGRHSDIVAFFEQDFTDGCKIVLTDGNPMPLHPKCVFF